MRVSREKPSSTPKVKRLQKFLHLQDSQDVSNREKINSMSTVAQSLSLNTLPSLQTLTRGTASSLNNLDETIYETRQTIGSITIINTSIDRPNSIEIITGRGPRNTSLSRISENNNTDKNPKGRNSFTTLLHRATPQDYSMNSINRTVTVPSKVSKPCVSDEYRSVRREQNADEDPKSVHKRLKYMREQVDNFLQTGLGSTEINQQLKVCFTHFKIVADKMFAKYTVMPDAEREVMAGLIETELYLVKLFTNIKKILHRQNMSFQSLNSQYQSSKKEIERLTKELQANQSEVQAARVSLKRESINAQNKGPEAPEMIWVIEKLKLTDKITALEEEVRKLTEQVTEHEERVLSPVIITDDTKINELEGEAVKKDHKLFKMKSVFALAEAKNKELNRCLNEVEKKYAELEEKHIRLQQKHEETLASENKFREMAYMSHEDITQKDKKYASLLEQSRDLQRKCFEYEYRVQRNKRDILDFNLLTSKDTERDGMIFEIARDVINGKDKAKRPVAHSLLLESGSNIPGRGQSKSEDQNEIPMEKLALYKPTYFNLIQEEYIKYKDVVLIDPEDGLYPLNRAYLATMRAILDSKYNEFMHYSDPRQCTSFPEFVYSWLNCFYVCPIDKTTKPIGTSSQIDIEKRKVGFYKFLNDPKLERTWEVSIFKDFLDEKCGADEIFFYLHCRYMLFEGEQLNHLSAALMPIDWVQLDKCKSITRTIFEDIDQEHYEILLIKFRERSRKKNKKFIVDASVVLKTLFEVYKSQKKLRLQALQNSFEEVIYEKGIKKDCIISFNDYKRVIDFNYSSIPDIEKVRLYRDAWCIGNGKVDPKTLIIAANESNLFLYHVKDMALKCPFFKDMEFDYQYKAKMMDLKSVIKTKYTQLSESISKIRDFAGSMGVESVISNIDSIEKSLKNQLVIKPEDIKGQGACLVFSNLLHLAAKIEQQYFSLHRNSISDKKFIIESQIEAFEYILKPLKHYTAVSEAEKMEKNKKARKIQMFFRKKKSHWYSLVKLLMPKLLEKKVKNI